MYTLQFEEFRKLFMFFYTYIVLDSSLTDIFKLNKSLISFNVRMKLLFKYLMKNEKQFTQQLFKKTGFLSYLKYNS